MPKITALLSKAVCLSLVQLVVLQGKRVILKFMAVPATETYACVGVNVIV